MTLSFVKSAEIKRMRREREERRGREVEKTGERGSVQRGREGV